MTLPTYALMVALALLAPQAEAGNACDCRFEVAGAGGAPLAVKRATRQPRGGSCEFGVRLRVADPERCTGTQAIVRGVAAGSARVTWGEAWERVSVPAGGKQARRRLLRARVRGETGDTGRARVALRCLPRLSFDGCAGILAESTYCFLGGGRDIRLLGLDSGTACEDAGEPVQAPMDLGTNLAVWNGVAYSCRAGSATGSFVAKPVEDGEARTLAGPCAAVTSDGESLLVLPRDGFDDPPVQQAQPHSTTIRAYDLPEVVPGGPYRVAFDLSTIPVESPCTGLAVQVMAARDGIIYASGCHPEPGGCTPEPRICAFDTRTGTTLPPIELQEFSGPILGMSAIDGARLLVLSDDQTAVPPTGYVPSDGDAPPSLLRGAPPDRVHVFDALTGARLDTRSLPTALSRGLSCVSNTQ